MNEYVEQGITLVFVAIYLAVMGHHAWLGKQKVHSLSDYLVAGRNLGGWVVALSFYATFMSTNTFIGAAGKSWDAGLIWCVGIVVYVGLCGVAWYVVAPRFVPLARQYGSLTIADFLGYHYQSLALRRFSAAIIVFASVIYLVAIYKGSALALEGMLGFSYPVALIMIFVLVTAYTLAGGFQSVILTDAVQGTLMVLGSVGIAMMLLLRGGGLFAMLETVKIQDSGLVSWSGKMSWLNVIGLSLAVGIKYVVEPRQLSRFYGLKNKKALKQAALIAPVLVCVTYVALLPVGVLSHALIPESAIQSSDEVIPYLLSESQIFGPVVSSLFLLVLLSAAMSSIDSVLLVAGSAMDHDLIASNRVEFESEGVSGVRFWVVVISMVSVLVALSPFAQDIMSMTSLSGALYGACFLPTLVVGLFLPKLSVRASLSSCVTGLFAVVGWHVVKRFEWTSIHEVYVGLFVGMLVFLIVTVIDGLQDGSRVNEKSDK